MKVFLLLSVFLFSAINSFSAVRTWDGGGGNGNWTTAANWVGDVAPANNDDLVFPATAAQFVTNNDFSTMFLSFASLTIEGGNYTIGGNTLRLINGLTVNGGTQALNLFISVTDSQTFRSAQGSTVTLFSLFIGSGFPNPFVLTLDIAGSFGIGVIFGTGSLTKTGLGALLIAGGTYDGAITHNNGVLAVDANIPDSTITINAGTFGGTDFFGLSGFGGTGTVGRTTVTAGVISAGTLTAPTGILSINSGLTFTANGNYVCKIGGTTAGADGHDQLNVTGTVSLNNARLVPLPLATFRSAIGDQFVILRNDGTDAINGTFLNAPEGASFAGALNTAFRITYQGGDGNDIVITRVNRAAFDFDADGRSDVAVFRPSDRVWYITNSSNSSFRAVQFGLSSDLITPADYDGDGKTDIAVFREGVWYWLNSSNGSFNTVGFGSAGDIPVPADYDGDGKADIAIYRPSTGTWWTIRSIDNSVSAQQFGIAEDKPAVGDYDGDGRSDLAVYRPSQGVWHILQSSDNLYRPQQFGIGEDRPVTGDYDGDGKNDLAVFRPSTNVWYVLRSSDGSFFALQFGLPADIQAPGDYDGDGKADIAVFRPSDGVWYVLQSVNGNVRFERFGLNGDRPTPSAFVPQ